MSATTMRTGSGGIAADDDEGSQLAPVPVTWGADLSGAMPGADYDAVTSSDDALLDWLRLLRDYGVAVLRNTPREPLSVLASRVSLARHGRPFSANISMCSRSKSPTATLIRRSAALPHRSTQLGAAARLPVAALPGERRRGRRLDPRGRFSGCGNAALAGACCLSVAQRNADRFPFPGQRVGHSLPGAGHCSG